MNHHCTRCGAATKNATEDKWAEVKVRMLEENETVVEWLCYDCTTLLGDFMDGAR